MFGSWEREHERVDSVSALHILTGGECACFISMISLTSEITKPLRVWALLHLLIKHVLTTT